MINKNDIKVIIVLVLLLLILDLILAKSIVDIKSEKDDRDKTIELLNERVNKLSADYTDLNNRYSKIPK